MFPILTKTPIKEIVLGVSFDGSMTMEMFEEFRISEKIHRKLPLSNKAIKTNITINDTAIAKSNLDGFLLKDSDNPDRVLQIRFGSMTLHWLNKYRSLVDLINELEEYWKVLTEIAKDIRVKSISVRYVNLIQKEAGNPIGHYVTVFAQHPFNTTEVNALTNIRFSLGGSEVTLVTAEGEVGGEKGYLIDYTLKKNIDPEKEDFIEAFNNLRDLKNTIFFKAITAETIKNYQS
ncbi:hypothetical protein BH09BAC5_BH09BAC5_00740 [soil metagenome]